MRQFLALTHSWVSCLTCLRSRDQEVARIQRLATWPYTGEVDQLYLELRQ